MMDKTLMVIFCQTPSGVCPCCGKNGDQEHVHGHSPGDVHCIRWLCRQCGCIIELYGANGACPERRGRVIRGPSPDGEACEKGSAWGQIFASLLPDEELT